MLSTTKRPFYSLLGVGLAAMMVGIDFSIVNATLPSIQTDLHLSIGQLQWLMAGFGITFCSLLVTLGRLADIVGRRKILYIGLFGFALTSLMAGLSTSGLALIIIRFFQGIFGAAIFPPGMAIVANAYSEEKRTQAIGLYGALIGIGLAFGPVIGGLVTSLLGWRWIFFINIPVVIASLCICMLAIRESSNPKATSVDYWGMALCIIFLISLTFGINEGAFYGWGSVVIISFFSVALLSFVCLLVVESKVEAPLLDLDLFNNKYFITSLLVFITTVAFAWPIIFLMPLYLQVILNYHVATSGAVMMLMTGMTMLGPMFGSYWYAHRSPRQIYHASFITMIIAIAMFCFLGVTGPFWLVAVSFLLSGFSWGVGNGIPISIALTGSSHTEDTGIVTGTLMTLMNTFGILSLTVITTSFRYVEKSSLLMKLQSSGIILDHSQVKRVRMLASDPEHMSKYLSGMSHQLIHTIITLFKQSFIIGMQRAYFILLVVSCVLWLLAILVSRGQVLRKTSNP